MGILLNAAYLMLAEGKRRPFSGKVLQLGKQSVLFPLIALKNLAFHLEYPLNDRDLVEQGPNVRMTDVEFFRAIGFSEVLSLEYGTSESADYVWDMNRLVPEDWHEKFDFIYDGGTVEHIFHIPNCMESICSMLKIEGRVMHDGGVSGTIDHGFFAIQPTLFYDFYRAQNFEIKLFSVSQIKLANWLTHTGEQILYEPGMYDYERTWALDAENIFVGVSFATKLVPFEKLAIPQQSLWSR